MGLYENVKAICEKNGTNIMKLEEKLGFARSSIYKWNVNYPSIAKIKLVADELSITVDELIDNVVFKNKKSGGE